MQRAEIERRRLAALEAARQQPEGPAPGDGVDVRTSALAGLANDRAFLAQDEEESSFQFFNPSTWIDTKMDDAKNEAREIFRDSVDRLEALARDPTATDEQIRAALQDKNQAQLVFNQAHGAVLDAVHETDFLTPVREAAQEVQDAVHGVTGSMTDWIEESGAPAPLVAAATLPLHIVDSTLDLDAGVVKGAAGLVQGVAGTIAHPVNTVTGAFTLFDRAAQTTLASQAVEFLGEVAFGRYDSFEEAVQAWSEKSNPLRLAQAKWDFTMDVGTAMLSESIEAWKEGKYSEAVGVFLGQNADIVLGAGLLGKGSKAGRVGRAAEVLDTAGEAEKTLGAVGRTGGRVTDAAAEASRAADATADVTRGLQAEGRAAAEAATDARPARAAASSGLEGTRPAGAADRIAGKSGTGERLLPTGNPTGRTLGEVRRLKGTERWQAAEDYVRELYGSPGKRHFRVPEGAWPEPIEGAGGRFVDAPVDLGSGRVLANEVKIYKEWRTVRGAPQQVSVPLTDQIQQQVLKDVWLRRHVAGYDPRWIFLDAPPSPELEALLKHHNVTHVLYQ
jgi:hypothetical protein